MSWIILVIAGLLEVVWAVGLKYTHGFSRLTPSVITVTAMIVSMALLAWAMKSLPVGTAYAVWTGIGAVGAAITGIVLLGESANPMRLASLALIVLGIIGLKLSTPVSLRQKWLACGRVSTGSRGPGRKPAHGGIPDQVQ